MFLFASSLTFLSFSSSSLLLFIAAFSASFSFFADASNFSRTSFVILAFPFSVALPLPLAAYTENCENSMQNTIDREITVFLSFIITSPNSI